MMAGDSMSAPPMAMNDEEAMMLAKLMKEAGITPDMLAAQGGFPEIDPFGANGKVPFTANDGQSGWTEIIPEY